MKFSNRTYALLSGISLLIMALAAGYAYGYVQSSLIIVDNPTATLSNLQSNSGLFASGIAGWILILITDLLVAWGLYKYFESVNLNISMATGLVRAIYSAILAFAIYQLVVGWQLLQTIDVDAGKLLLSIDAFEKYWSFGLIIFGFHLLGLGYLALQSNELPKWMGWLLCIAGFSYTLINGAKAMGPEAADAIVQIELILSTPMALAEILLAIWLIWKGGKAEAS